jgi:hypothetical protein
MGQRHHHSRSDKEGRVIDLHQGFSGGELAEVSPTFTALAMVQLDATTSLLRGQLWRAARAQLAATRLLGRVVWREVRSRLPGVG